MAALQWLHKFHLLLLPYKLILSNALKRNAPLNGLLAKKTLNASLLSKIVRLNADQRFHVGLFASLEKEVKLPLMLPNVPKPTTAYQILSLQLLLSSLLLNSALNNTAAINSQLAKKTQNASLPFKTAKRSA
jgi:hypothetical protein